MGNFSEQVWVLSNERHHSRTVQHRTGLSIRKVLRDLRPLRSATIEINGAVRTYPPAINPAQQTLLDALTTPAARH